MTKATAAKATQESPEPATPADPIGPIHEASREEGLAILDRQARRVLGISGQEFVRRWDAGEYAADPDRPGIMRLALLLPFAR
jgi:hypothetical protein